MVAKPFTYRYAKPGHLMAAFRAVKAAVVYADAGMQLYNRARANEQNMKNRRRIRQAKVDRRLQQSRLMSDDDFERLGMFEGVGPYIGEKGKRKLNFPVDWHIQVMGLSGSHKSTAVAMPMIMDFAMKEKKESLVCFDPKDGELSWSTGDGAAELYGRPSLYIGAWPMHGRKMTRLNHMDLIKHKVAKGLPIVDDMKQIARTKFGPQLENAGVNTWIPEAGMRTVCAVGVFLAHHDPDNLKPAEFHDFSCLTQTEFTAKMEVMMQSDAADGYVAMMAKKLHAQYGVKKNGANENQFSWMMESIQEAYKLYGPGSYCRAATEVSDFDIRRLKQEPRAVYICIPDFYSKSHAAYLVDLFDYIVESLARAPGDVRVNVLVDEFRQLPVAQSMENLLTLYRSKNLRLIALTQDRSGYDAYGKGTGYKMFEANSICLVWGIEDPQHLKDTEARAGLKTVMIENINASVGVAADGAGSGSSYQTVPLLPASEAAKICNGEAILFIPGEGIGIIERPPYWERDWCSRYIKNAREHPAPVSEEV